MFDDWNWNDISSAFNWNDLGKAAVQALPQAVAAGVGANMVARGNQSAADTAERNRQANIAAIMAGNQQATGMLQPMAGQQGQAVEYMRGVMARSPQELTPQQQIQLEDTRRTAVGMVPSSLRGSGRGVTAISNDVANRGKAGMIAQNQQRSDMAAQYLGNQGAAATNNMANIVSGQGPQMAQQNTMGAEAQGNAALGTATSNASTLGNIASFFANAQKDNERESRYKELRSALGTR